MSDENNTTDDTITAEDDFIAPEGVSLESNEFDLDLGGIDTSIPLMAAQRDAILVVRKAEVKKNKKETGKNLVLYFTNEQPCQSTAGVSLPPHECLISKYLPLQANAEKLGEEDYNPNRWKTDLAAMIDALFGTTKDNRPRFNNELVGLMKDRLVKANVVVNKPTEDDLAKGFFEKNEAQGFKYVS